jgi:protein TonB
VFDEVTKREGGKRVARRGVWVIGSSAAQAVLVAAIIIVSSRIAAEVVETPVVDVKFVKTAAPPRPPPPPPPPARKTPPKPKTDTPKPKAPSPMAMVQPRDVPDELKPPDPNEPPEPEYDYGSDEGVEGGVIGGVVGSGEVASQGGGTEDAPAYATAGFRKPEQAQRHCVQSAVRVPRDLTGFISGPVTVRFAIGRDGQPSLFQVVGQAPDPRISNAIWQAVQQCRWIPGADAQGRPTKIWVVLPVRFTSG